MDKISVIIPTYNRAHLILKSINSVLNQTYKNLEVIILDDGSTDNTEEVVKSINDKRVKYIKYEKNQGACHARNVGIESSTGKYIAFQDSDDIFHKDKLEKQLNNLKNNKADLDFCKILIHEKDITNIVPNETQEKSINKENIVNELCNANFISTQALLVKKSLFKIEKFDESLPRLQDYDLILRIINKANISYTNEILVDLYRQNDSISSSNEKLKKACILMIKKNYNLKDFQSSKLIDTLLSWINIPLCGEYETRIQKNVKDLNFQSNKISSLSDEVNKLNLTNLEFSEKIRQFEIQKQNFQNQIMDRDNIILTKEKQINDILNSKSWRFISYVRKIKNIILKIFLKKK